MAGLTAEDLLRSKIRNRRLISDADAAALAAGAAGAAHFDQKEWSSAPLGEVSASVPINATARRRRREEGGGRPHKVTVRLTDAEFERVRARAIGVGLTAASYLAEVGQAAKVSEATGPGDGLAAPGPGGVGDAARLLVEEGRAFGVLERRALAAELFGVRRLLIGVGSNLHQLARVANSTGEVPAQVGAAAGAVQRYLVRLEVVVAALDPRIGL